MERNGTELIIRTAGAEWAEAAARLEQLCFAPADAASPERIRDRFSVYPGHCLLGFIGNRLVSMTDGMCTDRRNLEDRMFADASLHEEGGAWQMVFGLLTHPDFRGRGYASELLRTLSEQARTEGRRGVVLTCKDAMVGFYADRGFLDEGISEASSHGGAPWHQMRLTF